MNKLKELFDNSCVVSCTTMTSELNSASELIGLIPDQSNYHLVSTLYTEFSHRRSWELLADIIQKGLCRNKIIDIMLPLQIELNSERSVKVVRVLLYRRSVLGIRMSNRQKQQRGRTFQYDIPDPLRKVTLNSQCPIGQFYVTFENTKLAPIFESEVSSDRLLLYHSYGCELFAVSGDISEDKKSLLFDPKQKLKNFCTSKKRAGIYCAALGSPTPTSLFSGQSFICLCEKILSKSNISVFENSEVQMSHFNLNIVKESVNYDQALNEDSNYELAEVEVEYFFKRKEFHCMIPEKFTKNYQPIVMRQTPKYYLWQIFKKYNKSTPFYVSSLLTEHNLTLIHLIDRIANQICNRQIPVFEGNNTYSGILAQMLSICDYTLTADFESKKYEVLGRVRNALEINNQFVRSKTKATSPETIYEYYLELITNQLKSGGRICFYTNIQTQISVIGNVIENFPSADIILYQDIARKLECQKICNLRQTYHIVDTEFGSEDYTRSQHEKVKELLDQSKGSLLSFLAKLLKAFGDIELEKLDVKLIPAIVRKHAMNDQITDYYLNTPTDLRRNRLNELLSQAQYTGQADEQKKEVDNIQYKAAIQTKHKQNQPLSNGSIQDKLEKIRNIKSTKYYNCHICEKPYPKVLGELCQCQIFHCLDCLKITVPTDQKVVPKCAYCLNKCTCKKCKIQKEKRQKENLRTECHDCNESRSIFIVCSKVTCSVSYCDKCYTKYSGGRRANILSLKTWQCFVCQGTCTCIMCRIRQVKKIASSEEIVIPSGTGLPQNKSFQNINNQHSPISALGLQTPGLQKSASAPPQQNETISKYIDMEQNAHESPSVFIHHGSLTEDLKQNKRHSDTDRGFREEKDKNTYEPTFVNKSSLNNSPKRGRQWSNKNSDQQDNRRGDDRNSHNNTFQRRQRQNRDDERSRSRQNEERHRNRGQNNRTRSRQKEWQRSKDRSRSRSRDKGLSRQKSTHKSIRDDAPLWGASTHHHSHSHSNSSYKNDKRDSYQNKPKDRQNDSRHNPHPIKTPTNNNDVDIDY